MSKTSVVYREYAKKFGNPPLPSAEWPLSKYGPMPPEEDEDLAPLLSRCLSEGRPATKEECERAAYFRDGRFRCPRMAFKSKGGEAVEITAETFGELRRLVEEAEARGWFSFCEYD